MKTKINAWNPNMMPKDAHLSFSCGNWWVRLMEWLTDIDMTTGKEERSTETTNLSTVIMDSSGGDKSDHRFVTISSIIYFPE